MSKSRTNPCGNSLTLDKWVSKLKRLSDRRFMNRKNYRKARFRKAEARLAKYPVFTEPDDFEIAEEI